MLKESFSSSHSGDSGTNEIDEPRATIFSWIVLEEQCPSKDNTRGVDIELLMMKAM
ncbi:hypothetical protein LINPERHAP2_LOCUS27750, partial [Linum perenne]